MKRHLGSVMMAVVAAAAASMLTGCAVQIGPTTQVAYDYSDYDYYDRSHAESPSAARMDSAAIERAVLQGRMDAAASDEGRVAGR